MIRFAIVFIWVFSSAALAQEFSPTFDHYYDGPEVIKTLEGMKRSFPDLCELRSIGKSEEGRDIFLLTITNKTTGEDTEKPGIYVDGAIHGNEIQATEVSLHLAWRLLSSYKDNPVIKDLVDTRAFYIIPVVNADNRWRFFSDPSNTNIGRSARIPHDDDGDGLLDEDDYDDLDGDGEILRMRKRDPFGKYKEDPKDPRIMFRVKEGERGEWTLLGREGLDNDGDGRINEDTPGYVDMNRNYGFKWQPRHIQGGAGKYPMSAKATKAVSDFIVTKPNICFNFAFHNCGGMLVRGPGSVLSGEYEKSDVAVYDFLGQNGERILPGYRYLAGGKDWYTTHGDFDEWMFSCMGVYGFVGELFITSSVNFRKKGEEIKTPATREERYQIQRSRDADRLKFNDYVSQGEMFKDWTKFQHPQFGEIEIGGWRAFTGRLSPAFMLPEMTHRNASMVIFAAMHVPDIKVELMEKKKIGKDLFRIRICFRNPNAIPTISARALNRKLCRMDFATIKGEDLLVVSGGFVEDAHLDRVTYVEHRPHKLFFSVPSFGSRSLQWIVKGQGEAIVEFDSKKAMNKDLVVEL